MYTYDVQEKSVAQLISLEGKIAVVTGAAQGIGYAIAKRLAESGAEVVIADLNVDKAEQSAEQIRQDVGGKAHGYGLDVSNVDSIKTLVEHTLKVLGSVDIWVNNAGIYNFLGVLGIEDDDWDKLMNLNLRGSFIACREAAKRMVDTVNGGVIINILSTAAFKTSGNAAHYVASKHGLAGLTKALAVELGERGVRALAVAPTLVDTPGVEELKANDPKVKAQLDAFEQQLPLRRMANPDDIARTVLFCASELSAFLTGVVIPVDGGETAL
ncbi:SDR family oxidoreductase [Aquimarina sp. U1-2]|uniref:SDR family NAD(P)-dependent oxidoreductase n=1 Tax=Aquimarina sp. U1-2 TaxID=2823141 RepID=UPI001AED0B6A|nr:SDR family NAD(P)-dependent oxidoreductase [Aquimarina sp. U1-2]MBP2833104.1 SDR family oxidoreductase [Aquimarina sp. U1-2]